MTASDPACGCALHRLAPSMAEELVALNNALADLAYDLSANPETLRHHMDSLQAVDRITQVQFCLVDLLRSTAPLADRVDAVTLEALATRLRDGLAQDRAAA